MRFHPRMPAALGAMGPAGATAAGIAAASGMGVRDASLMLRMLEEGGLCGRDGPLYTFGGGARLRISLGLLAAGFDVGDVSAHLGWRDFEGLAAEILESRNYAVARNVMLRDPRREIDVVGTRLGTSLLIDCKHWGRQPRSRLAGAARMQSQRAGQYAACNPGAAAVPVIVTLHPHPSRMIGGVPIVPVTGLAGFADEFYGNTGGVRVIRAGR